MQGHLPTPQGHLPTAGFCSVSRPELLNVGLQSLVAHEQGVVLQHSPVQPALQLAGCQSMVAHSLPSCIDATHVRAGLQGLQSSDMTSVYC